MTTNHKTVKSKQIYLCKKLIWIKYIYVPWIAPNFRYNLALSIKVECLHLDSRFLYKKSRRQMVVLNCKLMEDWDAWMEKIICGNFTYPSSPWNVFNNLFLQICANGFCSWSWLLGFILSYLNLIDILNIRVKCVRLSLNWIDMRCWV